MHHDDHDVCSSVSQPIAPAPSLILCPEFPRTVPGISVPLHSDGPSLNIPSAVPAPGRDAPVAVNTVVATEAVFMVRKTAAVAARSPAAITTASSFNGPLHVTPSKEGIASQVRSAGGTEGLWLRLREAATVVSYSAEAMRVPEVKSLLQALQAVHPCVGDYPQSGDVYGCLGSSSATAARNNASVVSLPSGDGIEPNVTASGSPERWKSVCAAVDMTASQAKAAATQRPMPTAQDHAPQVALVKEGLPWQRSIAASANPVQKADDRQACDHKRARSPGPWQQPSRCRKKPARFAQKGEVFTSHQQRQLLPSAQSICPALGRRRRKQCKSGHAGATRAQATAYGGMCFLQ
jgi:hypothetical protein